MPPITGVTLIVDCWPRLPGVTTLRPDPPVTIFGVPAARVAIPLTWVAASGTVATPFQQKQDYTDIMIVSNEPNIITSFSPAPEKFYQCQANMLACDFKLTPFSVIIIII